MSTCEAFAWIGQGFDCCADCGGPYWEHAHEYVLGSGSPFGEADTQEIPPGRALVCRRKWDPSFDEARAT